MDLLSMMNGPEEPLAHLTLQGHQTPQEQGEVFLLVGLVDLQTPPPGAGLPTGWSPEGFQLHATETTTFGLSDSSHALTPPTT